MPRKDPQWAHLLIIGSTAEEKNMNEWMHISSWVLKAGSSASFWGGTKRTRSWVRFKITMQEASGLPDSYSLAHIKVWKLGRRKEYLREPQRWSDSSQQKTLRRWLVELIGVHWSLGTSWISVWLSPGNLRATDGLQRRQKSRGQNRWLGWAATRSKLAKAKSVSLLEGEGGRAGMLP